MTMLVANGATCMCDKGSSPCALIGTMVPTVVTETLALVAAISDHVAGTHIMGFGTCAVDGNACTPITPAPWNPGLVTILLLGGAPILSAASLLVCNKGGTIRIVSPGQETIHIGGLKSVPGFEQRNGNDAVIQEAVDQFNAEHGWKPGDKHYLDPMLVKAWALTESGGNKEIYDSGDMMQVNNPGDWTDDKVKNAGITKGQHLTPQQSLEAALKYAYWKGSIHDAQGKGTFKSWEYAITRYNGGGDPNYWKKVSGKYGAAK